MASSTGYAIVDRKQFVIKQNPAQGLHMSRDWDRQNRIPIGKIEVAEDGRIHKKLRRKELGENIIHEGIRGQQGAVKFSGEASLLWESAIRDGRYG